MRLLIPIHEDCQQFDRFRFGGRRVIQGGQLKESICIRCKLPIIVYDSGERLGRSFPPGLRRIILISFRLPIPILGIVVLLMRQKEAAVYIQS